jgi:hypothetical protein
MGPQRSWVLLSAIWVFLSANGFGGDDVHDNDARHRAATACDVVATAGGPAPRRFVNVVIPVLTNVGAWSRTHVL